MLLSLLILISLLLAVIFALYLSSEDYLFNLIIICHHVFFYLIHVDVWGPYHTVTHQGMHYFLTIVDDYSRFTWIYLLHTKSEATQKVKDFFALIKTQFGFQIKKLRSANALELALTTFLQQQGTLHQFSCPYRPQQNFVVERKHQHLLNMARSLLFQSKVLLLFWGECVTTTTFL